MRALYCGELMMCARRARAHNVAKPCGPYVVDDDDDNVDDDDDGNDANYGDTDAMTMTTTTLYSI